MATVTAMEPPESLLTQLDRLAHPRPWLVVTNAAASLLTETCTTASVGSDHVTHLPLGVPIRITQPVGAGPVMSSLHVRIFEPWPATAASQTLATLTDGRGATQQLDLCRGAGETTLRLDAADVAVLEEPGWLDIGISFAAGSGIATVAHRGRVIHQLADLSLPVELTISPELFDAQLPQPVPTVAIARQGEAAPLSQSEALAHVCAAGDRLDQELPGWRAPNGGVNTDRPLEVFAGRREVRRATVLPTGRIEVLGFLSEGWQKRLDANEWAYAHRDGTPVDETRLDAYGRAGGLIAYVYDRRWELPAADETETPTDPLQTSAPLVYEGSRDSWVASLRNTETVLYQFATVWYLGRQTKGTDPAEATATLAAALDQLWHPTHAFHLDVVQILARAIGRYRFSDPEYVDRAPLVLAELRDRLGERGVASRTVVLS